MDTSEKYESLFPEKFRIFSGSALKLIAAVLMLIDHTAAYLLIDCEPVTRTFLTLWGHPLSVYLLLRLLGRLSFPLYAFLLVEGFLHTRNRVRYGRNLFLFALISELPWNFVHTGGWLYDRQNVLFTLFLGYLGICALLYYRNEHVNLAISLIGLLIISLLLRADYGITGFAFILLLYVLREQKAVQLVIGCTLLSESWIGGLAFIPINLYNGKRGFIRGKAAKYFFYVFYPVHLLLLGFLRYRVFQ